MAAAFVRDVDGDLLATATVMAIPGLRDRPPLQVRAVFVGVAYRPLRELWRVWGCTAPYGEVATYVRRARPALEGDARGVVDARVLAEVAAPSDAAVVADELAPLIESTAHALVSQYRSVDAIVNHNRGRDGRVPPDGRMIVPAMLAASGRLDEAREALARYLSDGDATVRTDAYRRFARQLTRWLDAGPARPVSIEEPTIVWSVRQSRDPLAFRRGVLRGRRAHRQAVAAVRRARAGKTRVALRPMVERELLARGVRVNDAEVEMAVDELVGGPLRRLRARAPYASYPWAIGPVGLLKIVVTTVRAVGSVRTGKRRVPAWLLPPEEAAYRCPPHGGADLMVRVDLDPGSERYLKRVARSSAPKVGPLTLLECWLSSEPDAPRKPPIVVNIGTRRVGLAREDIIPRYEQLMRAAALRDEVPLLTNCALRTQRLRGHTTLALPVPLEQAAAA